MSKTKPSPPPTTVENDLPEGWAMTTLGESVDVLDNMRVPVNSDERQNRQGPIPYYGATGQVGWIDDFLFDEELVLLGEDGAPFLDKSKPIAYIIRGKSWVNNHAHVLRAKRGLTQNAYVKHALDAVDFADHINGTTRLKLTQGAMRAIPFALPPLAEQKRIVAKVEALLARVNAARTRLAKTPAILKRFRQSVLAAACSGQLTADWREGKNLESTARLLTRMHDARPTKADLGAEFPVKRWRMAAPRQPQLDDLPSIPETWAWVYLPDLGYMNRGRSRNRPRNAPHLYGGKYPFIQTGDIARSGGRIVSHKQTYSEAGLAQSRLWPAGTICITIAANIADSAILTYPACFPDSVVGLITDPELCVAEFAEFFIRTAREDLSQFAPATAQKNINIGILEEAAVPLPPLDEQWEIVRRVEALFALADKIEARVQAATARVEKTTQAILAKAFRGELVPTEAELARAEGRDYEPATALLARIRTERAVNQAKPKKTRRRTKQ